MVPDLWGLQTRGDGALEPRPACPTLGDQKLYNLGLKGYCVKDDNSAGKQATEEEEGGHSQGPAEPHDNRCPDPDESELDSEAELMRSMGLPLQFGRMSAHKNFEVIISLL